MTVNEEDAEENMATLDWIKKGFKYDLWANRELLTVVSRYQEDHPDLMQLFAHIVAAHVLWLNRLQEEEQQMEVWPDLPMDECATWLYRLEIGWGALLDNITDADLQTVISYTNSKGEEHTNTIGDVANHVLLHGSYHRGQIAAALRKADIDPPYTDYIHATRQRFV